MLIRRPGQGRHLSVEELDGLLSGREGRLLAILGDTGPLDADVPAVVGVPAKGKGPHIAQCVVVRVLGDGQITRWWSEYSMDCGHISKLHVITLLSGGQITQSQYAQSSRPPVTEVRGD